MLMGGSYSFKTTEIVNADGTHSTPGFDLQYGTVLLALSSKGELEDMLDKEWPFFDKYLEEVSLCLNGTTCDILRNMATMLGKEITRFKIS